MYFGLIERKEFRENIREQTPLCFKRNFDVTSAIPAKFQRKITHNRKIRKRIFHLAGVERGVFFNFVLFIVSNQIQRTKCSPILYLLKRKLESKFDEKIAVESRSSYWKRSEMFKSARDRS